MNFRRALAATAGGIGFATLVNRTLTARAGELGPGLNGIGRTYRWRGFDVSYAEAGNPDDPDLLLLHGIHAAASNHEFAEVFENLATDFHVIAPDLPGFGRTDRPPVEYTASLYTEFVADFAADVTEDADCIASSLSGAYAARAQSRTGAFGRLVLICPTAETGLRRPWLRTLFESPVVGTTLFNALVSRPSLRWFSTRDGYYSPSSVTEDEIDRQWRSAHQPNARFAPAAFVGGFLDPEFDLGDELAALDVPITLVWGREALVTPLSLGKKLAERADAKLVVIDDARLLPHAEHPGPFLEVAFDELELSRLEH